MTRVLTIVGGYTLGEPLQQVTDLAASVLSHSCSLG
jgi:hypothetical protein